MLDIYNRTIRLKVSRWTTGTSHSSSQIARCSTSRPWKYIGPHYDDILAHRAYSKSQFGRDFVAEWHSHVLFRVRERVHRRSRLVVEGYLVGDCKDELQVCLADLAQVFQIVVQNRRYHWQHELLTTEQVAGLGTEPSRKAGR